MKRIIILLFGALLVLSCQREERFTVKGTISQAEEGEMIYLEKEGIEGLQLLDSVQLAVDGDFEFTGSKPESPDFYHLRLGTDLIRFCVDSTEIQEITGSRKRIASNYRITGNHNSVKMKEIADKQRILQAVFSSLTQQVYDGKLPEVVAEDSLIKIVNRYKEDMRLNYIFEAPDQLYAYYALFQQINGMFLFDVNNSRDIRLFQAVGTCMDTFWPNAMRTKNLHNIVMKGLIHIRKQENRLSQQVPENLITEAGVIEIRLPDGKGVGRSLTALKGKVVLLDFVAYGNANSTKHNFFLRELYRKYKDQGLEIFQVSEDADYHYWRTVSDALPWICVREQDETPAAIANTYNVTSLPTQFLISRENILLTRHSSEEGLEEAIKKQL